MRNSSLGANLDWSLPAAADLLVLDSGPLVDIRNSERIHIVSRDLG